MQISVNPFKTYYVVVDKKSLTEIRLFMSVGDARKYLDPLTLFQLNLFQIERVYLQQYIEHPQVFLITYLDRPSATSLREAHLTGKIKRLSIRAPRILKGTRNVLNDKHSTYIREIVNQCLVNRPQNVRTGSNTSTSPTS